MSSYKNKIEEQQQSIAAASEQWSALQDQIEERKKQYEEEAELLLREYKDDIAAMQFMQSELHSGAEAARETMKNIQTEYADYLGLHGERS